ncbi:hypothetical protein P43SY_005922 [Pythium insidiosum]|uniref:Uncharacterized protein n=1 Tax=Pythium insidiosum TaxID=114742 RepID=A0AAD5LJ08_PYTIN|nr:hypothetical protein P43SY_005922 [Pythium insidiosum]
MESAPWSQRSTGSAPTSARGGRRSASPPSSTSSFEYVPTYQQQLQPPTMFAGTSAFNRPRPSSAGSTDSNKGGASNVTQLRQKPVAHEPAGAHAASTTASFFSSLSRPSTGLTLPTTTTTTTTTASSAELFSMDDDDDDAWGVDSPSAVLGSTPFSDDEQQDDLGGGWDDIDAPTSTCEAPVSDLPPPVEAPSKPAVTLAVEASRPAPAHSVVAASIVSPTAALTTAAGDFWGDEGDDGLFSDEETKPTSAEEEVEVVQAVAEMSLAEPDQPNPVAEVQHQETAIVAEAVNEPTTV